MPCLMRSGTAHVDVSDPMIAHLLRAIEIASVDHDGEAHLLLQQRQIDSGHSFRQRVDGGFALLSKNTVGFRLGDYDRTRELVIDPVLAYTNQFGGGAANITALTQGGGLNRRTQDLKNLAKDDGTPKLTTTDVVRMELVGASTDPHVEGADQLPGKANYFTGNAVDGNGYASREPSIRLLFQLPAEHSWQALAAWEFGRGR
jgi:hypothetical protein